MSAIPAAASVLLAQGPGVAPLYVVRRAANLRFFGGFLAFPGGRAHSHDQALAAGTPGHTPQSIAACRELFEEAGVLLARSTDGSFPASGPELTALRRAHLAGEIGFAEVLRRLEVFPCPDDLLLAGSLVTPPFSPIRFDTAFYVAQLPPSQQAEVWPGELTDGAWRRADQVLADWTAGKILVSPPTLSLLEAIRGVPAEELPERLAPLLSRLRAGAIPPIWVSPGVRLAPLLCQGLLPASYTNAYLIGTDPLVLIDPGSEDAEEQQRLFDLLDEQLAAGRHLQAIVLTHQHPDHIGAARACARRYEAPILAHAQTAARLEGKIAVDTRLDDGDRIPLGQAPDGSSDWHLEAIHTPGHAAGHLAFHDPHYQLVFAGDMISTLSSVIIAPPEGDLTQYLASLVRLQGLPCRLLLPGHGAPSAQPAALLAESLDHRRKREEQLLEMLTRGPQTMDQLMAELYRGLPASLRRLAEYQLLAGLLKLQREGRASPVDPAGSAWQSSCSSQ